MTTLSCGHEPSEHGPHTTGTAHTSDGQEICWECAGKQERQYMVDHGENTMYLSRKGSQYYVQNWPGTLEFPTGAPQRGVHNICRYRFDFWFAGPDGYIWHGTQYGHDKGQPISGYYCHVKRTKEKI